MEKKEKEYKDYEKEIIDIDEVTGTDVKINPDFYIHSALIKAQQALTKENMKEGFIQFRVLVEHIEVLCKAANMLSDTYSKGLEDYKKSNEYIDEADNLVRASKLANKKLGLLMQEVFSNKVLTDSIKT